MHSTAIPFWSALLREGALSRRRFLRAAAGTVGGALGARLLWPIRAWADDDDEGIVLPNPIPGGVTAFGVFIHHFPPVVGNELSQIFDFKGAMSNGRILGAGTGTDTKTNKTSRLLYRTDVGFMKGLYVGFDGRRRHGTFGFV